MRAAHRRVASRMHDDLLDLLLALDGVRQSPRHHPEGDAHVVDVFTLELTVHEPRELRFRPRSSTDGKPIVRIGARALEALLLKEHGEPWSRYLVTGEVEGMEELLSEADDDESAPRPGPWDGLLASGPDNDAPLAGEPGEEDDPEESYEALPGFEAFG